jgi:glutathione S-transferase
VEVSPLTKKQLKWSTDYKKVPIAVFASDGTVVPDSAAIADTLLERFGAPPAATSTSSGSEAKSSFADEGARQWATWATSKLAVFFLQS